MKKIDSMLFLAKMNMMSKLEAMLKDEEGDTNFISIIIVLGIVLALVVVFRGYIAKILGEIGKAVNNFKNAAF